MNTAMNIFLALCFSWMGYSGLKRAFERWRREEKERADDEKFRAEHPRVAHLLKPESRAWSIFSLGMDLVMAALMAFVVAMHLVQIARPGEPLLPWLSAPQAMIGLGIVAALLFVFIAVPSWKLVWMGRSERCAVRHWPPWYVVLTLVVLNVGLAGIAVAAFVIGLSRAG